MKMEICDYCGKELVDNDDIVEEKYLKTTVRGIERIMYINDIHHRMQKSDAYYQIKSVRQEVSEDVCRKCALILALKAIKEELKTTDIPDNFK